MIANNFVFVLIFICVVINFTTAIRCDFRYEEETKTIAATRPLSPSSAKSTVNKKFRKDPIEEFDCEDDDYETIVDDTISSRRKPTLTFNTRFGGNNHEDDEFESVGSDCVSTKKTIVPTSLNDIYNKAMEVVNNASFVQSFEINTCHNQNEPCNNGFEDRSGRMLLCRQKYFTITLKAYQSDKRNIIDAKFYYPANCICELVQRKKNTSNIL